MALNLLLSVHGCACLNLIKFSALARRELVRFPLPGSVSEGGLQGVLGSGRLSVSGTSGFFPGVLLQNCPMTWNSSDLCHDTVAL